MDADSSLSPRGHGPLWRLRHRSEADLEYSFGVLMRVQAMWFFVAAFPSFVLVYAANSCVSFQGITPWIDFVAIQVMFAAASLSLVEPRVLKRRWFLPYHRIVAVFNGIVQLGALLVHVRGLVGHGVGLQTQCFAADVGGWWYTVVANFGGVLLYMAQLLVVTALIGRRSRPA